MNETKELHALFHLLDDPDQEVYDTVASKILLYGKQIIPNLENLWETIIDESVQERIEMLIHRVHYEDLQGSFREWILQDIPDLLEGAILAANYQFPDLESRKVMTEIDRIKRNIWLELNNYLTPLEQVNVLNSMVYNYFGLKGEEVSYQRKNQFFINQVIDAKRGNPLSNGIIYQSLCAMLDLPVYAVSIPRQYILAYFDTFVDFAYPVNPEDYKILFFIDPIQGQIYTQQDVDTYLKRINADKDPAFFKPLTNRQIISFLLKEMAKCFHDTKEIYKPDELHNLSEIINDQE
ncbi:Transglutaminase-like superfamily protein [Chitinophaga costaii]|uniref:Transglutaminase-like superfamily protein n=1 Tax=Chitinophaga costaii TaxID=1335309 RepID=A0A1C3ZBP2_9BACT|nr:transglutaminase-like domain-containing protein [Chitinophaga costaii]PUZ30309.1 hypothetical protein DCM91_02200 [Chitinophaga costaii]SCB79817.1 Transglutaminase-like superfamily protein [Chitinophaga costaii]